jgi:hypothetical protein
MDPREIRMRCLELVGAELIGQISDWEIKPVIYFAEALAFWVSEGRLPTEEDVRAPETAPMSNPHNECKANG